MNVQLIQTHDAALFAPVLQEVAFGDPFAGSLGHWCTRSERPSHLRLWEVFLALDAGTPVGVCGWYQTRAMPPHLAWLAWLGIRESHRRRGAGAAMLDALVAQARNQPELTELWVYTDPDEPGVHRYYERAGFRCAGIGSSIAPHPGMAATDKVFCLPLPESTPCQPALNLPRSTPA
ncbi:MAG: hypothetical protein RL514_2868 [Verrucomicrobiota bacterium]|jgi:RimJ/RimL family protein N-acetyltransferase